MKQCTHIDHVPMLIRQHRTKESLEQSGRHLSWKWSFDPLARHWGKKREREKGRERERKGERERKRERERKGGGTKHSSTPTKCQFLHKNTTNKNATEKKKKNIFTLSKHKNQLEHQHEEHPCMHLNQANEPVPLP